MWDDILKLNAAPLMQRRQKANAWHHCHSADHSYPAYGIQFHVGSVCQATLFNRLDWYLTLVANPHSLSVTVLCLTGSMHTSCHTDHRIRGATLFAAYKAAWCSGVLTV
jgi:hypothetical protein